MNRKILSLLGAALLVSAGSLSAKELQQFIINGQSLSTGHQSWPVISVENVPGNYMLGNEIWINAGVGYDHNYNGKGDWEIRPLIGTMSGAFKEFDNNLRSGGAVAECPLLGAVNHMQLTFLAGKDQDILATSVGVSGAAVEELSKECTQRNYYNHFLESVRQAEQSSRKAGYDAINCPAIFWMQGEFNYEVKDNHAGLNAGEDNCTDKKTYKALMVKLKDNMQQDIMTTYGQTKAPVWITYQTGGQYVRGRLAIAMAQLEAANENPDIIMAGSPYPYTDRGGHLDANGYRWFGEMLAKAYYKSQVLGEKVVAMQPRRITREDGGRTIRVKYYVPVGPMVFDTDLLPKIKNYGFNVYLNGYGSGARQNIQSIAIDGDDVVMTFAQPLAGKVTVTYGDPLALIENQPSGLNHLQGHGNLRDSDPYESALTYIDLDGKDAAGNYIYSRNADETRLRPDYEPKDASGNVIYGKPYPLYNFSVSYLYTLDKKTDVLDILDDDLNPLPVADHEPGTMDVAYVSASGSDAAEGTEEAPFATLQKAVASIKAEGGKVMVAGTIFIEDELDLEEYKSLAIEGVGSDACIDGSGITRLGQMENANVAFANITLTNFATNGAGGVFAMTGGNFTADGVTFENNTTSRMADDNGGALWFKNCGNVTITDCLFRNNTAFLGGAIYVNNTKQLTANGTRFEENKAAKNPAESNNNSRGGAISMSNTSLDCDDCVFIRNESTNNQCGVFQIAWGTVENQHFTLRNCDILDNKAPKDHGGVLVAENAGQKGFEYNFINCTIAGNTASGCGSVAWVHNNSAGSPTQTMNFYNCTITANHSTGNTYHNTILLWGSDIKVNLVNTILEGNTAGNSKEYADIHAGEYTAAKSSNITLTRSVLGKLHTIKQDETAGEDRGVPVCDEHSQLNISPDNVSQGEANFAGIVPSELNNSFIFKSDDSNGIGMGDDSLLASKFGVTTDRFGTTRTTNSIGSVESPYTTTGIIPVSAPSRELGITAGTDCLTVSAAGKLTVRVYTVEGRFLGTATSADGTVSFPLASLGHGIRVISAETVAGQVTSVIKL